VVTDKIKAANPFVMSHMACFIAELKNSMVVMSRFYPVNPMLRSADKGKKNITVTLLKPLPKITFRTLVSRYLSVLQYGFFMVGNSLEELVVV